MGLFSKKPGGTFFGNLLRGVANKATGGLLGTGANRIEVGQTKTNAELTMEAAKSTTFAGQPATVGADGTIAMSNSLKEVSISPEKPLVKSDFDKEPPKWLSFLGDKLSYLGQRTTENTAVGVDNKTLFVIGGGLLAVVLVLAMNKK